MTVTTNGPITIDLNGSTKTITINDDMPHILFQWVYGNVQGQMDTMKNDGLARSIVNTWIKTTDTLRLREIESSMDSEQRRRFHVAMFTCMDPEEALMVLSTTTIHRLIGAATMPKIEELLLPYRKDEDKNTQGTLHRILDSYDKMKDNYHNGDDGQRQDAEERLVEVKRLEENLSQRIAIWNEERKMAEKKAKVHDDCYEQLDELHSRYVALDYENSLLRELLKILL